MIIILGLLILFPDQSVFAQNEGEHPYPRLANCYLRVLLRDEDVNFFGGWDLFIFSFELDRREHIRENLVLLKSLNPDMLLFYHHFAPGVRQPNPLYEIAEEHNWWLRDYEGNILTDNPPWSFNRLLNMTDTEVASGSHPQGLKPNQWVPEELITNHINKYDFWDGISFDVYASNLAWISRDIKDANKNQTPEYDHNFNGDEPRFNDLWSDGMISLVQNTLSLNPDVLIIGNGLHNYALPYLNGRFQESFRRSTGSLSTLVTTNKYITETGRDRPISILNANPVDRTNPDPTDYVSMRFPLICSLLVGAYYSFDFGDCCHNRALWFDEYSVKPDGEVAALSSTLRENISPTQNTIPVVSTAEFPESGVLVIGGEHIYYASKTDTEFSQLIRYYPADNEDGLPHENGATVIHYLNSYTGYLGHPKEEAYDVNEPSVKLSDLFIDCAWNCKNVSGAEDNINSRIWRRDFDKGIVLLNPSDETKTVTDLGEGIYRKIKGLQDTSHNDGQIVNNTLTLEPKDGYILIHLDHSDQSAPNPPQDLKIIE
jgi:hypothetical protein